MSAGRILAGIGRGMTTVDRLPRNDLPPTRGGYAGELRADDRAKLDAMREQLLELMRGNGVTPRFVTDRTGLSPRIIVRYFRELGAEKSSHNHWRMHGASKPAHPWKQR